MKMVFSLLMLLLFAPAIFAAEGKSSDFNFGAEFRFRDIWSQNPLGQSGVDSPQNLTKSRIKFDTTVRASERFTAHLGIINSSTWGSNDLYVVSPGYGTGDTASGVRSGSGNANNLVLINEGYGAWMVSDSFLLRFGRGAFNLGDGSVISTNDYQDFPYSFDGVLGVYEWEFMRLSAWVVQFANYSSDFTTKSSNNVLTTAFSGATAADPGATAYGLALDWKMLPAWLKMANVHLIKNQKDQSPGTTTTPGDSGFVYNPVASLGQDNYRYGLTVGGDTANIDYNLDFNAVTGNYRGSNSQGYAAAICHQDKCSADSYMLHGIVGYTIPKWKNSHVFVVYHMDSGGDSGGGQFKTYDSYFYDVHNMYHGGLMDVVKWGNLSYFAVGYTITPLDHFDVTLLYHKFQRTVGSSTPFTGPGVGPYGYGLIDDANTYLSSSKNVGQEVDLAAIKKYDGGFEIEARAGMFMPGTYVTDNHPTTSGATYTQVFLQGKMVF